MGRRQSEGQYSCGFGQLRADVLDHGLRRRDREPVFLQSLNVELNCLADLLFGVLDRVPNRDAARQIGDIGGVVLARGFDYDG